MYHWILEAAIHSGRDNKYLEDYIWERFGVWILFLPTRAPEWNPQELVWQVMVKGMSTIPLRCLREVNSHSTVYAADASLKKLHISMWLVSLDILK